MKTEIKIAIVEDELIIAEKIKHILAGIGYTICDPVTNFDEALAMIVNEKPDLLLLDVNLNGEKDGIDIARKVNEQYHIPYIFLTAYSDGATIERAKAVKPLAYLVKPFTKEELFASIEIAFNNYRMLKNVQENNHSKTKSRDFVFLRESHRFIKVAFSDIAFIESRENYVIIHSGTKKDTFIRSTFSDFLAELPPDQFCRVHRSFAVQTNLIEDIEPTEIIVAGYKVPASSSYRAALFAQLGIKE